MKTVKVYQIEYTRISLHGNDRVYKTEYMTLEGLKDYFGYDLECGKSWEHERGNYKIKLPKDIKTIKSLITNLDHASYNSGRSYQSTYYSLLDEKKVPEDKIVRGKFIEDRE